jgi:hypothetical protein
MIPKHLCPFFWDANTDGFGPLVYPMYTVARLLEYGDAKAISWLKENFSTKMIENVIRTERTLSPRSANFWALIFDIPCEEIASLKTN